MFTNEKLCVLPEELPDLGKHFLVSLNKMKLNKVFWSLGQFKLLSFFWYQHQGAIFKIVEFFLVLSSYFGTSGKKLGFKEHENNIEQYFCLGGVLLRANSWLCTPELLLEAWRGPYGCEENNLVPDVLLFLQVYNHFGWENNVFYYSIRKHFI